MKRGVIFILFLLLFQQSYSQIIVKDTAFANLLCERFPFIMTSNCTVLDTLILKDSMITELKVNKRNTLQQIDEIVYFKDLQKLSFTANNIQHLPDLTQLKNLVQLELVENPFTILPNLTGLSNLKNLNLRYSMLTTLPDLSDLSSLEILLLDNSNVSSLSDLSSCSNLKQVDVSNNYLSFDDLKSLVKQVGASVNLNVFPQKNLTQDITLTLKERESITLTFPYDVGVTGLTFKWYNNNVLIKETTTPEFSINAVTLADTGNYRVVVVSNDTLLKGTIQSGLWHIHVQPFENTLLSYNFAKKITCDSIQIGLDVVTLSNDIPFQAILQDASLSKKYLLEPDHITNVSPGTYHLIIIDSNHVSMKLDNVLTVDYAGDCENYFSPDGDGQDDFWLIKEIGMVNVFDISGTLVSSFKCPVYWDGSDFDNQPLPEGKYAIFNEKGVFLHAVTLIRY